MTQTPKVMGLIVAAGSGSRAGGQLPKQYSQVRGKPVLTHAIDHLLGHPSVSDVRVVIGVEQEADYASAIQNGDFGEPVIGGATRQASVLRGLESLAERNPPDIVLIHDAARPFIPIAVIDRLLVACETAPGAIPTLPVTDSLANKDGQTVPRENYVHVQTPQAFAFDVILKAHRAWNADYDATDDAEIARSDGYNVVLVNGDPALKKLTFAEDFEDIMTAPAFTRTGLGYDVHAFAPGDHVWLGGVRIEHTRGLAGHSDADVALHALTDAILGALGAGDIGDHFPSSDAQWKGAPSHQFLKHARDLAERQNQAIHHVDITIVCEEPKISPHRAAMRARIAEILALPEKSVSVKATTTERLGFTGRGEGIAAQAVATLGPH